MADSWNLLTIFDRILNGSADEDEIDLLRQSLTATSTQNVVQLGKYNVNIAEGKDIHIGDKKVYQGTDAETIRAILREILSQNTQSIEIKWHDIGQTMLSEQLRLTTNPLTSVEGISYRTEQVYVPLGLVERKKQARRREDIAPEQGSQLYQETEITQTFEHQEFLKRVLKQRQSPKSQGKRIAIIGEPGAGKTTLLQQIARWVCEEIPDAVVIWVSLADLRGRELEAYLFEVWLQAVARKVGQAQASTQIKDDFVAQFNQGLVWLLLDGVDEMQATVGNPLAEINRQLRTGTLLQQARIVLSCRLNLWDGGSNALDSFDNYRTLEFSYPQQVEQFIGNWFASLSSAEIQTGQRLCAALGESGKERIRDLVKNPLRLTLLCFNWYLGEGKLPGTKAGLYEQFVADFYEWKKGQFATTGEQRKRLNAALGELAREAIDKEETRFRLRQEFVCEYLGEPDDADSLFGLALRLGWLNKVGVDEENPRKAVYAFFHPTFQEYFAALPIEDWHYFLNHIPENPKEGIYRIFEPQWQEVFPLWLGRTSKNKFDNQKECFLKALINFQDDCGNMNLYGYHAKFIAASGIAEFRKFSHADEVITSILNLGIHEIATFNNPIVASARNILIKMDRAMLANALSTLVSSENTFIQHDTAKLIGEIGINDSKLVKSLNHLIKTTKFNDTHCYALCSLLKLNPDNEEAIEQLIKFLDIDNLATTAAQGLGFASIGNAQVINSLENFIKSRLFNQDKPIFALIDFQEYFAVQSLLKIDTENQTAKLALQILSKIHVCDITRSLICQSLETYETNDSNNEAVYSENIQNHIDEDITKRLHQFDLTPNSDTMHMINILVNIMCNNSDKNARHKAAWCLEVTIHDNLPQIPVALYPSLVKKIKLCLNNCLDKNNSKITYISIGTQEPITACNKILWSISQRMPYLNYYNAWHE